MASSEKAILRRQALQHRHFCRTDEAVERLAFTCRQTANTLTSYAVVGGYWATGTEASPLPLLQTLAKLGCKLALPRVVAKDQPLLFHSWQLGQRLKKGFAGIMEPLEDAPTLIPNMLIVPLLAFDEQYYRLGYGGGYYDRTIAEWRKAGHKPAVIGLAFEGQRVATTHPEAHDQHLDAVLTESGLFWHSSPPG